MLLNGAHQLNVMFSSYNDVHDIYIYINLYVYLYIMYIFVYILLYMKFIT